MPQNACYSKYRIPIVNKNNRKADPGWISYLRMSAFCTQSRILSLSCKSQPAFLIARFLIRFPVYCCTVKGSPIISSEVFS